MDEHRQLQAVVAALLALASAILGVSTLGESLSSHRPPAEIQGPSTAGNGEGVLARLWEDPITAVTAAAREGGGRSDGHRADVLQEAIAKQIEDEDLTVLAVMVDGTPFVEDVEARLRLRYALTAALIGEGYKPTKRTTIGFVWTDSLTARQDGTAARPFTGWAVFPPMQVLNVLLDPAASFRWDGSPPMPASHDSPGPLLVPYEFWEHGTRPGALHCDDCTTRKKPQLLVLWLAEEELAAAPLRGLEALLGQIIPMSEAAGHKIDVALIGPRSSDTLQAMSRPAQGLRISSEPSAREGSQPATVRSLRIISPSASAPEAVLRSSGGTAPAMMRAVAMPSETVTGEFTSDEKRWDVPFTNLIPPDDEMALALVDELERRGVKVRGEKSPHRIVLLSEADTTYGRALPRAFAAAAASAETGDYDTRLARVRRAYFDKPHWQPRNISAYSYLRGLDGRTARTSKEKKDEDKRQSTLEDIIRRAMSPAGQAAEGEIQFDYLERLATELQRQDTEWAKESRGLDRAGVRAIGILGSDPYDKLVILQAFRPRFPEAVFFTTELDARLWDTASRRLTHNLLVAAAFDPYEPDRRKDGARPGDTLPHPRFPPFRDSAQAGLFHAVRLAVTRDPSATPGPPLLFEIGRHRPVRLRRPGDPPERPNPLGPFQWLGVVLALGASGGIWLMWRHQEGKAVPRPVRTSPGPESVDDAITRLRDQTAFFKLWYGGLSSTILLAAAGLFWWWSGQPDGEPLALGEGVSVWPTELIRVGIVLLVIGLVRWAWLHHKTYRLDAWRTFFAPVERAGVPDFDAMAASKTARSQSGWIDARDAFRAYVSEARLGARLVRTAGASAVYLVFGFGIFFLCGIPVKPARNLDTWRVDFVCLFASVAAFNFLVFYVVDTTLVTRRLLKRLAGQRTAWPAWVVRREADALGLKEVAEAGTGPEPSLAEAMEGLIDVQYASRHTEDLGGRFYLPFLVMLLMIVSRSRLFDNWGWPPSMILINLFGLMLVVSCALLSRRAARDVRNHALAYLEPLVVAARGRGLSGGGRPNFADLQSIHDAIARVRQGAYARFFYDPALLSILIPTGGYGVFVLVCQFLLGIQ